MLVGALRSALNADTVPADAAVVPIVRTAAAAVPTIRLTAPRVPAIRRNLAFIPIPCLLGCSRVVPLTPPASAKGYKAGRQTRRGPVQRPTCLAQPPWQSVCDTPVGGFPENPAWRRFGRGRGRSPAWGSASAPSLCRDASRAVWTRGRPTPRLGSRPRTLNLQ